MPLFSTYLHFPWGHKMYLNRKAISLHAQDRVQCLASHKYLVNAFRINLYIQTDPTCTVPMENQKWAKKGNQWGLEIKKKKSSWVYYSIALIESTLPGHVSILSVGRCFSPVWPAEHLSCRQLTLVISKGLSALKKPMFCVWLTGIDAFPSGGGEKRSS